MEIHDHSFLEVILTALSACFTFAFGHNFWLTAKEEPEEIKIELVTSDKFPESDSAVKLERIKDFRVSRDNEIVSITEYQIENTTLFARVEKTGKTKYAVIELYPHPIALEAEKFAGYIISEEAEKFVAPDFIKGKTEKPQRESYAKFAKVLLDNNSFGEIAGHKLEIVLLNNPSELQLNEKLKLKVFFDDQPIENLRVSGGAENINSGKYTFHARTDAQGCAEIETAPHELCFLRTHFIRPHFDRENFDWESFWASITFRL